MSAYVIAIHGGAGVPPQKNLSQQLRQDAADGLEQALLRGHAILKSGGTALDAVQSAVQSLEDDPNFNAGVGAALTSAGHAEHDAAIMDGRMRHAGAVMGTRRIKNPIALARMVMERSGHMCLQGKGAEEFALAQGLPLCDPAVFVTPRRLEALARVRAGQSKHAMADVVNEQDRHGTVGAVAMDSHGNLAAATSTGGLTNKMPGRVGDSPIVGAGTYADNKWGAFSGTGRGEYYLRMVFAHRIACLMELKGLNIQAATSQALAEMVRMGGGGGVIGISAGGEVTMQFTGDGMYRGVMRSGDEMPQIAIYTDPLKKLVECA